MNVIIAMVTLGFVQGNLAVGKDYNFAHSVSVYMWRIDNLKVHFFAVLYEKFRKI